MGRLKPVLRAIEHPRRQTHRLARSVLRTVVGGAEEVAPRDVWRWTSPKYRIRTVGLLLLNAGLFAGLGFFAFWLRTGAYGPFSQEGYWHAWWRVFDPTKEQQVTLMDFLVKTIPVDQVPIMTLIMGLLLASMTAIPILVSMLYRFPFSLIFTAIIAFVAVFPWLAITVTFCCFLARWRPFRFQFRFATALLALLPVVLYYALATRNADVLEHLSPVELAKLYIPWVLALIAACTVMGVVLGIARLVNDRPGAIAPLMAVLFALPIALFEIKVGRDELYYRIIEQEFGPGSTSHFADRMDADDTIRKIADRRWEQGGRKANRAAVEEQVKVLLQFQFNTLRADWDEQSLENMADFAEQQYEAVHACETFLKRYPASPYCPNVLFLQGRALDMRIDHELFQRKGILRHYDDFPSMASRPVWERLVENYPRSVFSRVGMCRLGLLRARSGDVDGAEAILKQLARESAESVRQSTQPEAASTWRKLLAGRGTSQRLGVSTADIGMQGQKLLALISQNRDPQQKDLALRVLLSLDPHDPMYAQNLRQLLKDIDKKYPLTLLKDNIEVAVATAQPSQSLRIKALEACVQKLARQAGSDAFPQAQYELGLAYQADNRPAEAKAMFDQVVLKEPTSPWAMEARRQLAEMGGAAPQNRQRGGS
jgi:outer membrane protein assembly factor BamD (BamD/ComL family)